MRIIYTTLILIFAISAYGQSAHKLKKEGETAYKNEEYNLAEEKYRKAIDKKADDKARFNLGNTLYNQERFEEAQQYFEGAAAGLKDEDKSKALFNKGNAYLMQKKYDESIDAYKEALKITENDEDIRKNLTYAQGMKKMEQMMEQMQEQFQDQQEKREEQKQEEQQQQQNEEQQENQDQQQQDQNQQNQDQESQDENEQDQPSEGEEKKDLSKDEALKLLDIIEDEEQKVQEKLRKIDGKKKKPEKDW